MIERSGNNTNGNGRYRLIALDVDGTLLEADGAIAPQTLAVLRQAEAAGVSVCLATGRSYIETIGVWRQLGLAGPHQPMVLIGGALVSEQDTGRTLFQKTMSPELAGELSDALAEAGRSSMAIVDAWRHGFDYYFRRAADAETAYARWFGRMNVKVRSADRLPVADSPAPLRVSCVVEPAAGEALAAEMKRRFAGRLEVHAINAPNYGVMIVEAFAAGVSKWTGVMYLAQAMRIAPRQIVAVGDDVNDLAMVSKAGLGAAMPASAQCLLGACKHRIDGTLGGFVQRVLAGEFEN
jgi:5-amino-6-(5-phospho-D-ribitylamino)uracil phosphatase